MADDKGVSEETKDRLRIEGLKVFEYDDQHSDADWLDALSKTKDLDTRFSHR